MARENAIWHFLELRFLNLASKQFIITRKRRCCLNSMLCLSIYGIVNRNFETFYVRYMEAKEIYPILYILDARTQCYQRRSAFHGDNFDIYEVKFTGFWLKLVQSFRKYGISAKNGRCHTQCPSIIRIPIHPFHNILAVRFNVSEVLLQRSNALFLIFNIALYMCAGL